MILRFVRWSVTLCLALQLAVNAEVKVVDHAYENVLVSFARNVPNDKDQELIESIKKLFEDTSLALHTAVGIRIGTVTIRLPSTWSISPSEDEVIHPSSEEQAEEKSDILVDATEDSAFGKQPIALQYGGCGVKGHQVTVPLQFLNSSEDYPKGKLLAREWLKYRYGVFDENGFVDDSMYPDYYRVPGSPDIRVTECTSPEVQYYFKNPATGENCSMDIPAEYGICRVHPDPESIDNVTSSLMYFHEELPNMEHVCGKNHSHKDNHPSKQNILCSGSSIWEVLKSSSDIPDTEDPDVEYEPVQYVLVQDSNPRYVVLWEDSDQLLSKKESISFAVRRFFYDLPSQSKCGLYEFSNEVTTVRPYSELAPEREDLNLGGFGYPSASGICVSCAVLKAVEYLQESTEKTQWGRHDHSHSDAIESNYKSLSDYFDCYSYIQLNKNNDRLSSFISLYDPMTTNISNSANDFEIKTIKSSNISYANPVVITKDGAVNYYTLWFNGLLKLSSVGCKMGETSVTLQPVEQKTTISSYTFKIPDGEVSEVSCRLLSELAVPVLTQVQMTTQKGHYFDVDIWTHSTSTKETEQMPVVIYAKVNFGRYPVKEANVSATVMTPDKKEFAVQFFDNGRGDPDITQYDGIYSGYFTDFTGNGSYEINVKIHSNQGQTMIGKKGEDICCGSQVKSDNFEVPPFELEEKSSFIAVGMKPDEGYKPSRIMDLKVRNFEPPNSIRLEWTAPGIEKADRYIFKLFQSRENAIKNFGTSGLELNASHIVPSEHGVKQSFSINPKDLEDDVTCYVSMRAVSEKNQMSEISNAVEFFIPLDTSRSTETPTSPTPTGITGDIKEGAAKRRTIIIIVGVLVGVIVICICVYLGIYFCVQKPRRREVQERIRKKKLENGANRSSGNPPGQIGLNSMPADVILKHHNEVVTAKSLHKDPPIFTEANIDSYKSSPELPDNSNRNNNVATEYSQIHRVPSKNRPDSSPQDPSKSPKRMTVV
ncbi:calcium-activated chloride channel regulator 2 [Caerostris darwini]|uniref:Calcium-activated chloride channel regulator 2 n=1 Tax=Caerostris darwini TaxID=1538125 RepID=A0AAV4TFP7_9ARAC|nr:calcium-activated chloride channel regulator 2 [Caerostris darwini]